MATLKMHPARWSLDQLLAQVRVDTTRSRGPGGQHRNKVETGIRLVHLPTGLVASGTERRSKNQNLHAAVFRLRVLLALAHREDLGTGAGGECFAPSELWKSRCRNQRLVIHANHQEFPALLAEALDVIQFSGDDLALAARLLEVSTSQLVRFLAKEPRALGELNLRRRRAGRHPFRADG